MGGRRHHRDRIGRDHVHVVGDRHRRDLGSDGARHVRDVHDGGVGFARRDLRDDGCVVFLVGHDVGHHVVLDAGALEALSRVVADRDALGGEHDLHAGLRQVLEARDVRGVVDGGDDDQLVLHEVGAARDADLVAHLVHVGAARRREHVGRSLRLDRCRQVARRPEVEGHRGPGVRRLEVGSDLRERRSE